MVEDISVLESIVIWGCAIVATPIVCGTLLVATGGPYTLVKSSYQKIRGSELTFRGLCRQNWHDYFSRNLVD